MKLIKYLKRGFVVGIILAIVLFIFNSYVFSSKGIQFTVSSGRNFLVNFMFCFVLTIVNMSFFDYLDLKTPFKKTPRKRILFGFFGALILSSLALYILTMIVSVYVYDQKFIDFFRSDIRQELIYGIIVTINVNLIFHIVYFYKKNSEKKIKESKIVEKTSTAQFESLKSQLDPHFLFNSLNVLTSLIGENPRKAEKFTTKLSKVYRYVLEQRNKELVPVAEELKFAKTYLDLLKMRFEDAIISEIPLEISNPELKIVPLSLQLLLENATKHNVVTAETPLKITIREENGYLIVDNNYNPKKIVEKGTKVGLQNIKDRYALLSKTKVEIHQDKNIFEVKIPMLIEANDIQFVNSEDEKLMKAKQHVKQLKEFYMGLMAYCLVIPGMIAMNLLTYPNFLWFFFPMIGWGIGMIFQAIKVFGKFRFIWDNWEERKINELIKEESEKEEYFKNRFRP
ncbi:histidine kinase [Aureivirga sp. CE67]|uniref:histidine kinase n=1 Tax=Aureivirga sp. CE67 TaxID=1788983 RepID=UPI0018CBB9F0|nr:histidine kinase [Aureivirga sp. CE67]